MALTSDDEPIDLDHVRRLIRSMEDEAIKYNDEAVVRRVKHWRRVLRAEEQRQRGRR